MDASGVSFGALSWIMRVQGRTTRGYPGDEPDILSAYWSLPLGAIDELDALAASAVSASSRPGPIHSGVEREDPTVGAFKN